MGFSRLVRDFAIKLGPALAPLSNRLLRRPVFVVGFNKSAKSMLVQGLAQQSHLSVFPGEGNEKLWFRGFYPWSVSTRDLAPLWYEPENVVSAVLESRPDCFRQTRAQLGIYQMIRAPANLLLVDSGMLAALLPNVLPTFPDAKVLHVVRDGRVVSSIAARKTLSQIAEDLPRYQNSRCRTDPEGVLEAQARYWCWTVDRVNEAEQRFPNSVKQVKYEDWCADPEKILKAIMRFIGLNNPRRMSAWEGGVKNTNNEELANVSESELSVLERIQSPHLVRLGYES